LFFTSFVVVLFLKAYNSQEKSIGKSPIELYISSSGLMTTKVCYFQKRSMKAKRLASGNETTATEEEQYLDWLWQHLCSDPKYRTVQSWVKVVRQKRL